MADQPHADKLFVTSVVLKAIAAALQRCVTSPFKGDNGSNTYFKDVVFAAMRAAMAANDLFHDRHLQGGSSTENYLKYASDHKFVPDTITLASGTQAHWLGSSTAKKVLVYFPGGGYVVPCTAGLLLWLDELQKSLGPDVSVLVLAYDLAPQAKYPTQLRQATELLEHLVYTQGRDPSDLILGGDSAGGNLTLGLLSHLAHPHPDVTPLSLPSRIHAVLLISPWCAPNHNSTPSFVANAQRDMFGARALSRWAEAFLGSDSPFAGDVYNEPALATPDWWAPVADFVDQVLIWAGGNEVLLDGIEAFAEKFTKGFGGRGGLVNTIITPKAAHEEMVIERSLGYKGDSGTGSQQVIETWIKAKL
ncbi:uncharacterized protein SETTUDRAFT_135885 [Exserohilum turcica Et28A]|uniref:Alpha/beta hydrolase fold-3 domain-containing protein n=1 Tax=Exserohilum turcicum (strain 28A) TaxID=671987 RepID=R0K282_EXST2|nr:uncharacterized protein SETTUDRAFT_135885 [Exserohilum turcica Et28A]EOA87248.1 hypothetical protein SETTUDRAFT_135885 [Exserohilum turcica Et28A]